MYYVAVKNTLENDDLEPVIFAAFVIETDAEKWRLAEFQPERYVIVSLGHNIFPSIAVKTRYKRNTK